MACTEDMLRWSQFVTKKRFSFDTELLVIASSHNIDLVGSPVRFKYDSERSTMNFVSDSVSMFADLLHIKYRKMKSYYLK
jgi:hypothetical protein